jgi:hypothetical protein
MPSTYDRHGRQEHFTTDYDGDAIASHLEAERQAPGYRIQDQTRVFSNREQLRAAQAAERARQHNATQVKPHVEANRVYVGDELVTVGSAEHVEAVLRASHAYPVKADPADMTEVERAQAAVQGLAMIASAAAANLASAQTRENERGPEPPVGSTVRFAKHYTSKADGKQYAFAAISVAKDRGQRRWHHSGSAQFAGGLPNPCSWEELNDFADEGSVEVGTAWVQGRTWPEGVAQEAPVSSTDDRRAARYAEELNGVLYQAAEKARDALGPAAAVGTTIPKWRVRDAHNALVAALNEHASQQERMARETEGAE